MKIAVCKYPVEAPRDFAEFAAKQRRLLEQAAGQGAQWAVLPEYLSLELGATFDGLARGDLQASLAGIQRYHQDWLTLFDGLARDTGMRIVAGTFLLDAGNGSYRNRAYAFAPDGSCVWQDKLQMTGFEKKAGTIHGGDALKVLDAGGSRAAIAVCYDIEFPLPVRAQCEAGAKLLIVPSCTDAAAGAMRVRVGCLARALENRCYVAQSVTAGEAPWSPALDFNAGEATVYAPIDAGFPSDGILAQTQDDQVWAFADLDFEALEASRGQAQVANDRDWPDQFKPGIVQARVERL